MLANLNIGASLLLCYPKIKVLPKSKVEWGYYKEDSGEWTTVNKEVEKDAPEGIEKKIGFEGIGDPTSGYYCHYKEGRIVEKESTPVQKAVGKAKR